MVNQVVAILASAGFLTWLFLILLDTVVGIAKRSIGGKFDPNRLPQFLASNFASRQALAMASLVGAAVVSAVSAYLLHHLDANLSTTLQVAANTALLAFTAGVAAQDASLVADIKSKLFPATTVAVAPLGK